MPKTVTKTYQLFQYDELPTEAAKEKARDWFLKASRYDEWWENVYEDAKTIGLKITGFNIGRANSITGDLLESAVKVSMYILDGHGKECNTFKTAERYRDALADLGAKEDTSDRDFDDADEQFKKELLEDYLHMLRQEYKYQTSRETVEENIRANEYTFLEDGRRED